MYMYTISATIGNSSYVKRIVAPNKSEANKTFKKNMLDQGINEELNPVILDKKPVKEY